MQLLGSCRENPQDIHKHAFEYIFRKHIAGSQLSEDRLNRLPRRAPGKRGQCLSDLLKILLKARISSCMKFLLFRNEENMILQIIICINICTVDHRESIAERFERGYRRFINHDVYRCFAKF